MTARRVRPLTAAPTASPTAFVASGATVIGNVTLGDHASVWYGAVIRADLDEIRIGPRSNIQDGCVLHTDPGLTLRVGAGVSVGHRAVLHGCTVSSHVLIGIGAIVLNGATIGAYSIVAAGTVVLEGQRVPPGSLVAGIPARVRRALTSAERSSMDENADLYVQLAAAHRQRPTVPLPASGTY